MLSDKRIVLFSRPEEAKINHVPCTQTNEYHVFDFDGKHLAFDANSMYLFEVDDLQARLFTAPDQESALREDFGPAKTAEALKKNQGLCQLSTLMSGTKPTGSTQRKREYSTLWLHLSHRCNLVCKYCFADGGSYRKSIKTMDIGTAMRSLDWLLGMNEKGASCRLVFFGGEPLLNFEVLKKCVLYGEDQAHDKGMILAFHLITNGTLITTEIARFLKDHQISLQFSLDGPQEVNDFLRPYRNGRGSYGTTYKNYLLVRKAGIKEISIRSTLTHFNTDVFALQKFFDELGVGRTSLVPVQANPGDKCAITAQDIETIQEGYKQIAEEIMLSIQSSEEATLSFFAPYLLQILQGKKKRFFCGAGYGFLSVTPDGSLYPCHRLISQEGFQMGSVHSEFSIPDRLDEFGAFRVDEKDHCRDCWARYFCGGGCSAAAYALHGKFSLPDPTLCEILRTTVETTLGIYNFVHNHADFMFDYILPGKDPDCTATY